MDGYRVFGSIMLGMAVGYALGQRVEAAKTDQKIQNELRMARELKTTLTPIPVGDSAGRSTSSAKDIWPKYGKVLQKNGYGTTEPYPGYSEESEVKDEDLTPIEELDWDTDITGDDTEPYLEGRKMSETLREMAKAAGEPYVLTEEEYFEPNPELSFDKETLTFFAGSNTLVDAKEEIIPNPTNIVGQEALDYFRTRKSGREVVYARNEKIATDFEIIREDGTYGELILGIIPEKDNE